MRRSLITAGCGVLLAALVERGHLDAEPRRVNLRQELDAAQIVTHARIVAYAPDGLKAKPLPGPSPIVSARYSTDPTWRPGRLISGGWPGESESLTAYWPPVGSEVLLVANPQNIVSLFAKRQGDAWRFWSPEMTGSVALFECEPPAIPVEPAGKVPPVEDAGPGTVVSWDGCLVPVGAVMTKGVTISS